MSYIPQMKVFHDRLLESQYWSHDKIVAEQRAYLTQLLRHAKKAVPFYRARLDGVLSQSGEVDWARWEELPVLTRSEALAHNDALASTDLPAHQGATRQSFTSGSTGPALRVVDSQLSAMYLQAAVHRMQSWHRMDFARDLVLWFGEDSSVAPPPGGEHQGFWGPPWSARATGRRIVINRYAGTDDVLKLLLEPSVGYFSARPAAADAAAQEALRLGTKVALDGIFTFSTGVRQDEREDFRKAFGARAIVPYSAKEGHLVACQCPTGTHFHINEELVFVEIVDAQGHGCAPGEVGRVLVTPLYNYAMPFVRYELGDLAAFGPPCQCGRTLRVLDHIAGRVTHMFRLPGDRRVSMSLSPAVQEAFGARYWQIAQVEPLLIEVRYVPSRKDSGDERQVIDIIRQKTVPEMQVRFSRRVDLNRPDGRKFIEYAYEVGS
ncbi:MAG: hypothetical protein ABL879_02095 [Devosia sp.]